MISPGPWKRSSQTMIHAADGTYVARLQTGHSQPPLHVEANGNAIVALPELIQALLRFAIVGGEAPAPDCEYKMTGNDIYAARSALQKAGYKIG